MKTREIPMFLGIVMLTGQALLLAGALLDCHFVREKLLAKEISTEKISSNDRIVNILTKAIEGT